MRTSLCFTQVDLGLLVRRERRGGGARALVEVVAVAVMVEHDEIVDRPLHRLGQVVVGAVHVGEEGVAASRRHLDRVQHRHPRGDGEVGIVGVEVGSAVGEPGRRAIGLAAVREDQDVRLVRMVEGVNDVRLRLAEAAREGEELALAPASAP